jgi:hypothetical protein
MVLNWTAGLMTEGSHMADLTTLHDEALAYLVAQLEKKISALKLNSATAIGAALLAQYQDKLTDCRLEMERRACD